VLLLATVWTCWALFAWAVLVESVGTVRARRSRVRLPFHRLAAYLIATITVVAWMFTQRLAGHSLARITRALNDAQVPCPSAADPTRNGHRLSVAMQKSPVVAELRSPLVVR
jgi:hypothetical protein